jgi:hypothetical protein
MFGKRMNKFVQKYDSWRLVQTSLVAGIVISVCVLILELVIPVRLDSDAFANLTTVDTIASGNLLEVLSPEFSERSMVAKIARSGLFKLDTSVRDKPMADRTIEMIRSQLKLQCILELDGEPVAYVHIKDKGLHKCRVGDSVDDLFTVIGINEKSIEITIVGHSQILSL